MPRMKRARGVVFAALCAFMLSAGAARAQSSPSDSERAERFFLEGRASMKAHRYEEACAKFAESQRFEPASGTLLNLAACREAQGRSATAWGYYNEGLTLSRKEGNREGERLAVERLQALEPVLCRLTIVVPERQPKGLVVTLDAARLAPEGLGEPVPVDPGTHVVRVSAPERKSWTERVNLVEQGAVRVVRVPALEAAPVSARRVTPALEKADTATKGGVPLGTVIAGAVSVVAFASTAYFGVRAKSEWDTRDEHCPGGECDQEAVDASKNATRFARIADGSAVVGVVAAGVAIYFALAPTSTKMPSPAKASGSVPFDVQITSDRMGLCVGGVF
jgi:hypothetical protein